MSVTSKKLDLIEQVEAKMSKRNELALALNSEVLPESMKGQLRERYMQLWDEIDKDLASLTSLALDEDDTVEVPVLDDCVDEEMEMI